jgi:hypothetical protein
VGIDIAVWEGRPPGSDVEAAVTFDELYGRYVSPGPSVDPSPRIVEYVAALLDRYPDLTVASTEETPWGDGPLINCATGPLLYWKILTNDLAEDALEYVAETARSFGLVCFDTGLGEVLR